MSFARLARLDTFLHPLTRHLNDSQHRETFESAHSVILAIFASHAAQNYQRSGGLDASPTAEPGATQTMATSPFAWLKFVKGNKLRTLKERTSSSGSPEEVPEMNTVLPDAGASPNDFVRRMVPFYASCLLQVSFSGSRCSLHGSPLCGYLRLAIPRTSWLFVKGFLISYPSLKVSSALWCLLHHFAAMLRGLLCCVVTDRPSLPRILQRVA